MKKHNKRRGRQRFYIHYGYDDPNKSPILLATSNFQFAKQHLRDLGGVLYQYTIVEDKTLENGRRIA